MAHRPGHQTIGASLAGFLGNLGQAQLAEGERSREETRAERLRLRIRKERLQDVKAVETRADTRELKRSQLSAALSQFRAPTSQNEIDIARNELQKLGIDTAHKVFTGPQSGRDFMEELRLKLASQERIAKGRVSAKVDPAEKTLNKQFEGIITELDNQVRQFSEVERATVRQGRAGLDSLTTNSKIDPVILSRVQKQIEEEEFKQLDDLLDQYNEFATPTLANLGFDAFKDEFKNQEDLDYFVELAIRYPNDDRVLDIMDDDDFPKDVRKRILREQSRAQRPTTLSPTIPATPVVDSLGIVRTRPKKNRFF